jgi:hypothetical protein
MTTETLNLVTPETPWRVRSKSQLVYIFIASTLPAALTFLIADQMNLAGLIALIIVFLPLQLLAASIAALITVGKRGILDAILTVSVLFLMLTMGFLLGSVALSLVQKGYKALSFHAIYHCALLRALSTVPDAVEHEFRPRPPYSLFGWYLGCIQYD